MLRSLPIWMPAVAFVGAIGFATIALTTERPSTPDAPAAAVSQAFAAAEARPPEAILRLTPAEPAPPRPSGILTYRGSGGEIVSIDPGDPASPVEVIEDLDRFAGSGSGHDTTSPDGRHEVVVRRSKLGVWIDILSDGRRVESVGIAGPSDPQAVDGGKSLAAAVDGVPLTIAWSPDSRYLAYGSITGAPFSLAVLRVETGSTVFRQVAGGYVGELAWAPDASYLAISTYELDRSDHTVLVYDPRRTTIRQLIDGCVIVWSPDASFLAVHREPTAQPGVWLASPDGETRLEVTADPLAFPLAWVARSS